MNYRKLVITVSFYWTMTRLFALSAIMTSTQDRLEKFLIFTAIQKVKMTAHWMHGAGFTRRLLARI